MEHRLCDSIYMKFEGKQNSSRMEKKNQNDGYLWVGNFNFKRAQGNFQENGNVLYLVLVDGYMSEFYQNSVNCVIGIYECYCIKHKTIIIKKAKRKYWFRVIIVTLKMLFILK